MIFTTIITKRAIEKIQCYAIFLIVPAYFLFQICVIRPFLREHFQWSSLKHFMHVFLGSYLFINVAGNLIFCVLVDSRVQNHRGPGRFCDLCVQKQPTDSWHCATCNACIVRRDHHCAFLGHCIGRDNIRYFTCFFCHLAIAIIYTTYYNYQVLKTLFDLRTFAMITSRFFDLKDWCFFSYSSMVYRNRMIVFFWYVNLVILPFAINLALFHLYKAFRGMTWYEFSKGKLPMRTHWKRNMEYVFGTRWYVAILWPLVGSPLPYKGAINKRDSLSEIKI